MIMQVVSSKIEVARKGVTSTNSSLTNSSVKEINMAKTSLPNTTLNFKNEEWRPAIVETYEVSNRGKVRNKKNNRLLKPYPGRRGYLRVKLDSKNYPIHKLVALAFIGEIPEGFQVNHKNFDKENNTVWNLEIITQQENINHARENQRYLKNSRKLTERQVRVIKHLFRLGETSVCIARIFKVTPPTISAIRRGKTWTKSLAPI